MKYLKLYESFNEKNIHNICEKYGIQNYTINDDGSIDVDGDVDLYDKNLNSLLLKFRNVMGNFYCNNNQLTSLEGCPESVGMHFSCRNNKLTSLEGCPKSVGGGFYCQYNKIVTFEHLPYSIGGNFLCFGNPIDKIWYLFDEDYSKIEFLNDCDAIREPDAGSKRPVIISDRFDYFLEEIGKKPVAYVKGYDCI